MALQYTVIPVTPFEQNCTLIWCDETDEAVVLDPGGNVERILSALDSRGLQLKKIWLTHAHIDHVGGVTELLGRHPVPVEGPHRDDAFLIQALPQQGQMMGLAAVQPFEVDRWLEEGETVQVGHQSLAILHCPGHAPGQITFFHEPTRWAQVGDALFQGSIGRTDLPGGDYAAAIASVKEKLFPLGDDVTVTPGHGPETTIGAERRMNPFFRD